MDHAQTTRPELTASNLLGMMRSTGARQQRYIATAALMATFTGAIALWLLALALDAWLILSSSLLLLADVVIVAWMIAGASLCVWCFGRQPTASRVATRWDEHRDDPAHRLRIAAELSEGHSQGSATLIAAAVARVMRDISPGTAPLPRHLVRRTGVALLLALVAALAAAWLVPGRVIASSHRLLSPFSDLPPYTATTFDIETSPDPAITRQPWSVKVAVHNASRPVELAWLVLDEPQGPTRVALARISRSSDAANFTATLPIAPTAPRFYIDTPAGRSAWQRTPIAVDMPPTLPGGLVGEQSQAAILDAAAHELAEAAHTLAKATKQLMKLPVAPPAELDAAAESAIAQASRAADAAMNAMGDAKVDGQAMLTTADGQQLQAARATLRDLTNKPGSSATDRLVLAHEAAQQAADAIRQLTRGSGEAGVSQGRGKPGEVHSDALDSGVVLPGSASDARAAEPSMLSTGVTEDQGGQSAVGGNDATVDLLAVPPMYREAASRYLRQIADE